ncbi:thiamine-monophosphate kinase [Sulfolobus sp. A20]|uniref:AIR synthase related protein n=2 Tax=Sulfolobaceae TaxID=118883 RepID=UPI000845FB81|nr:AIR synthase related protein [Sulfolobus sp. A20]AOL16118.1 thiamine-monophosphate kinase [Sulfolobus sp. A20]TRM99214.1 thiamine-monophosphate kinase [Sulfolobus sp. F1]
MKLKDLGEHTFIRKYLINYTDLNKLDDVYIDGDVGYKLDGFRISYAFNFMSSYDLGWKSIIAATSDMISKAVKPTNYLVSIGLDKNYEINQAEDIIRGISDAIHYYEGRYVGGDLNDSTCDGWIDVFVEGKVMCNIKNEIGEGDYVLLSDYIGYTTNIFLSYLNNFKIPILPKSIIKVKHPIVNKALLYFFKKYCNYIKYSTDISDGLIISLYNIVENFNFGIKINDIPIDDSVMNVLRNHNISESDIIKYSGEEFIPILILDKYSPLELILNDLKLLGYNPTIMGRIIIGDKLIYRDSNLKITGWDNFLGWY